MKLTSSATFLSTVIDGIRTQLLNEVQSESAKANGEYLLTILRELLRREQCYPTAMPAILENGHAVIAALRDALRPVCASTPEPPLASGDAFDDFNLVSTSIAELTRLLSKHQPNATIRMPLLRRAAEWESGSHNALARLDVGKADEAASEPLTREALQDFIRGVHPDREQAQVSSFDRVMGGFGKQTWAITVDDARGTSQPLIVRKCEKVPVCDHRMFNLNREFDLLKDVSALDFPAPKPLWMGNDVPGSDAPFYVMERLPGNPPGSYLQGMAKLPEHAVLEWAEVMAKLHSIPLSSLAGFIRRWESPELLHETMEQTYRRALAGWRDYVEQIGTFSSATLCYLFDWLDEHVPRDHSRPSLVHGDFGVHNMLTLNGKVTGLLDWEATTFGSPLIDLSYVKPKVEQQMEWNRFVQHYFDCGGPRVDLAEMPYYEVFQLTFIMVPMNRALSHVQSLKMRAPRFTMFELGFLPQFMRNALAAAVLAR
jgi:aminoglycoside phosphotransferase (APT) family kinase protein